MFASLNICKSYDLSLGNNRYIPLKIHIKDIKDYSGRVEHREDKPVILENKLRVYKETPNFSFARIRQDIENKNALKEYFKFIDTEIKIFEGGELNFLEYYGLNKVEGLLYMLEEEDYHTIITTCNEIIEEIKNEFNEALDRFLFNGETKPKVPTKNKNIDAILSAITKYSNKPTSYLVSQLGVEYEANVFFEENIGKAISDWSFREVELQIRYLVEKNVVDGLFESYKSYQYEQAENNNKK